MYLTCNNWSFPLLFFEDVREWLHQNYKRYVTVKIGSEEGLSILNRKGETLRKLNFINVNKVAVEITQDEPKKPMVLIKSPSDHDHDLVLQFDNNASRKKFVNILESFLLQRKKTLEIIHTYRDVMLAHAETYEKRRKKLDRFFRDAYALTFGTPSTEEEVRDGKKKRNNKNKRNLYEKQHSDSIPADVVMVMRTSLSRNEFADALGMKPDSLFVKQMFNCVDKDKDGRISFQEFLDTVVMFSRGKSEDKLKVIFDMCDNQGDGIIDKEDLTRMLHSLVDIAKTTALGEKQVTDLIEDMFASVGLEEKDQLTWNDFKLVMKGGNNKEMLAIGLDLKGANLNYLDTSNNNIARMTSFQINQAPEPKPSYIERKWNSFITFVEENRQHIFYLFIFFVTTIVLFFERFYNYSYLSEHTDLRHVMGVGIAVTRGSAASLSFCYSLLLLTMCRNLITKIRECSLHQYIPLDSHVQFHKIVAYTALFFTLVHTIGHVKNFYHVSTQPLDHLKCLVKEMSFDSDNRPTFTFWIFGTVTGITGVLLFAIVSIIFIFAQEPIRRKAYYYFWSAHKLYVLLYILSLFHGLAKLTGTPRFWIFFIIPAVLFIIDKIISLQTKFMELEILETELLPSDVTKVKFSRPPNFKYLSGQWIRLCCTGIRNNEFHSFTLTSAPHENYLSVHVKAQGPWTWKLRNYFDPNNYIIPSPMDGFVPKIRLEGPFGGGNQDWYKHEIAIMVGGGIGVTPYASILNDLVFGTSTNRYSGVACKKVYFLWICQSHKHFEWFIDVLRDVERRDVTNVLEVHIFITKFFHKFDLRTTMLYICENHFQRLSNKSMFTGLKAINHFGRPPMVNFLKYIQKQHSYVSIQDNYFEK